MYNHTNTTKNWNHPENISKNFQNMQRLFPSQRVVHHPEKYQPLAINYCDVLNINVDEQHTVKDLLQLSYTDAFVVIKEDTIVAEHYFNGMSANSQHLLNSVTKSFVGMLAGIAVNNKKLNADEKVTHYMPEFTNTAWENATVREVLDMTVDIEYDENYADKDSSFWAEASLVNWSSPLKKANTPQNLLEFAGSMVSLKKEHGKVFNYRTVCTNVLGMIIERAMQCPLATLIEKHLWAKLNPAHDASVVVDSSTFPYVGAGMSTCARDLARFGMMMLNDGKFNDEQVVPKSWIEDTLKGNELSKIQFDASKYGSTFSGWHYRNQVWVPNIGRDILLGVGIHGQALFVDKTTRTVIVKFSSQPEAEAIDLHVAGIAAMNAVSVELESLLKTA